MKNWRTGILFLIFLSSNSIGFAQEHLIDSLLAVLQKEDLSLSDKIKSLAGLGNAYTYVNTDSSIEFYTEAIELAHKNDLDSFQLDNFRLLGRAYYIKGEYNQAYTNVSKALALAEENHDLVRKAKSLNSLGTINHMLNERNKAIQQHQASIRIFESLKDTVNLCNNFLNLSIVYQSNGQLDSALLYIEKTIKFTKAIDNSSFLPISYGRYGEILFELEQYREAEKAYLTALEFNSINNWDKGFNLTGLAIVNYKMGNFNKAIDYASEGIEYSLNVSSIWDLQRAYEIMAKSQEELGDFEQANRYNKLFKIYSDSLFNSAKENDFRFLLYKEEELKNALLSKENENAKNQLKLKTTQLAVLGVGMFVLFLFSGILYKSRKSKQRLLAQLELRNKNINKQKEEIISQNIQLQELHKTKDKLFSIISHDLKSPIASLQSLMDLATQGHLDEKEMQKLLKLLSLNVKSIQELLNNLLHWAKSNLNDISPQPQLVQLSKIIEQELKPWEIIAKEKGIQLEHQKEEEARVYFDPDHLRIIIRNLVGNAIKFTDTGGLIKIFYKSSTDKINFFVSDNGTGIAPEKLNKLFKIFGAEISEPGTKNETGTGIGLNLIDSFLKSNQGSIEVESELEKGTTFKLTLPRGRKDHT